MKKSLKKVLALMLALAVILATFKVAPASNVEAKSTKYKAGSVYISPDYLSGYSNETIWKSMPKTRARVYNTDEMYVYYNDMVAITDVKVKGKGLVAFPTGSVSTTNGIKYSQIEFEARKAGTYTVSFKIQRANGSKTKSYSFKVFASASTSAFKSIKFAGKTVSSSKGSVKKGVRITKTSSNYKISKASGKLQVTGNSGYKITGLVVVTNNGKNYAATAKSYKNGAYINTSKNYAYTYKGEGEKIHSEKKHTAVYISYKDTKLGTYVKYSVTKKHGTQEIKCVSKSANGQVTTSYSLPSASGGNINLWRF